MVTTMGFSNKLGNVDLHSNYDALSSTTKQVVEDEVRRFIEEGRLRAEKLLTEKSKELHLLAKALVDYETLDRDECFKVIKGEKLPNRPIAGKGDIKVPEIGSTLPEIPGSKGDAPSEPTGGAVVARWKDDE